MMEVWVVIEDCGDYYNPESMIGIATSEEEANRLIAERKAALPPYYHDYKFYTYPQQLNVLVT